MKSYEPENGADLLKHIIVFVSEGETDYVLKLNLINCSYAVGTDSSRQSPKVTVELIKDKLSNNSYYNQESNNESNTSATNYKKKV